MFSIRRQTVDGGAVWKTRHVFVTDRGSAEIEEIQMIELGASASPARTPFSAFVDSWPNSLCLRLRGYTLLGAA